MTIKNTMNYDYKSNCSLTQENMKACPLAQKSLPHTSILQGQIVSPLASAKTMLLDMIS